MIKVKGNKVFRAYKMENENSLDEFLANEVRDYDSIRKKDEFYKIYFGGIKLFEFKIGNWLVVFADNNIREFEEEEFFLKFSLV